jgi:AraC-like DNA-binding protein
MAATSSSVSLGVSNFSAAQKGWLGALRDPQIGRAIALIHKEPSRPLSLAALSSEAAMSRSAFASRFSELVGEPPLHYLPGGG